jgi:hypothetical protein
MIVRVLRASIATGRAADFHAFIEDVGLPNLLSSDGLIDVHVGLRAEGSQEIGLIVSVWRDWASLEAAVGPDPSRPYMIADEDGLLTDVNVEHFEALGVHPAEPDPSVVVAEALGTM